MCCICSVPEFTYIFNPFVNARKVNPLVEFENEKFGHITHSKSAKI